jgi:F0F1-type ATP synthase gamma subunit
MFFFQSIFRDFLEAKAAEYSARLFGMENATDNPDSLSKHLAREHNKARQEKVTNEIG